MPNPPHEMLHGIFREDSHLFSRILRIAEIPFPVSETIKVSNIDATETKKVLERRMDTVLEAQTASGPILIVIEAQNKPHVDRKLRNWAYYPAYLHELHGCPVVVIVVCRSATTAAWARKPYHIGLPDYPSLVSTPIVFGPDDLPRITSVDQVIEDPYLAVFCALAYAHDAGIGAILNVVAAGLAKLGDLDLSKNLHEIVERGLQDTPALEDWRKAVSYVPITMLPRSRWARENIAKGEVIGVVESILRILDHRGVELSAAAREHVSACEDIDLAKTWLDESLTATVYTDLTGLATL
ncbi:MAG TPA: hypothetical protein VFN97_12080 [Actinospica sp.]|nr:hypothetical protein [Actinospica sp.]